MEFPEVDCHGLGFPIHVDTEKLCYHGRLSNSTLSLWHNSLIRISTFREFRSQQFHEGHNLFANYLDDDVPAMFEDTL